MTVQPIYVTDANILNLSFGIMNVETLMTDGLKMQVHFVANCYFGIQWPELDRNEKLNSRTVKKAVGELRSRKS